VKTSNLATCNSLISYDHTKQAHISRAVNTLFYTAHKNVYFRSLSPQNSSKHQCHCRFTSYHGRHVDRHDVESKVIKMRLTPLSWRSSRTARKPE